MIESDLLREASSITICTFWMAQHQAKRSTESFLILLNPAQEEFPFIVKLA